MNLRRTLKKKNLIDYQKKKAIARRVIKEAKRESWRQFCSTIGRETTLNKVWMMVKKMIGKYKPSHIPILIEGGSQAILDTEKAKLLGKTFANIHKGNHLGDRFKKLKKKY